MINVNFSNAVFYSTVRTGYSNTRFFFSWIFFSVVTCPRLWLGQTNHLPVIFVRLAFIPQNFLGSCCSKSLTIEWHKSPFDESKNEDANEV